MLVINFNPFPLLSAGEYCLRPLSLADVASVYSLRSDQENNRFINRPLANSEEDALAFINTIMKGISENEYIYWVIEEKNTAAFAGTIGVWKFDKETKTAEIGYELLPAQQGRGIMRKIFPAILSYLFDTIQLSALEACVHHENIRSVKFLEHFNFINQGNDATEPQMLNYILRK